MRIEPWIQTYHRMAVHPLNISPTEVSLEDIAHALSMKVRYTGHCRWHYSVAQHCVIGAQAILPRYRLAFLLHELGEVWLPDIASPIKPFIKWMDDEGFVRDWKDLEAQHTEAALTALGLTELTGITEGKVCKLMDHAMLWAEIDAGIIGETLFGWGAALNPNARQLARSVGKIEKWSPERAENEWLNMYYGLT